MTILFRVLYAAHAKGTHHKLALDALNHLTGPDAELWRRVFLKHATVYLQGSKAPDDEFKDFKNHVLHVRDDYWGGAPAKARSWYTHLVEALERSDWQTAAYCAGVLSHYVTDPIQPFHTGQSEAENNIHRAAEWSISKSYDELKTLARELAPPVVMMAAADNWLERLICECAAEANRHYEKLIAHYDIHSGVVHPPSGLDALSRRILAGLITLAAAVHGAVLQRAIEEAKVAPPEVSLSLESVIATLQMPAKWVVGKLADAEERRLVQRMYDELQATGTVEENLPEDDRMVRDLHASEVVARRARSDAAAKFAASPVAKVETTVDRRRRLSVVVVKADGERRAAPEVPRAEGTVPVPQQPQSNTMARAIDKLAGTAADSRQDVGFDHAEEAEDAGDARGEPRIYLSAEQEVVDAPSIGPKTAERLNAVGIDTVDDLLKAHPIALAARLNDRHITEQTVADWQDQARLVCAVAGLRGTGAQLLVGAGYRTADAIAEADADKLCADVLNFASGSDGQRILRNGNAPDIARIRAWMHSARRAKAA